MFTKKKILLFTIISSFILLPLLIASAEETTETNNLFIFRRGNGVGNVTVKENNNLILTCGDTCAIRINRNATFTFSAEANEGSIFQGWSMNQDNTSRDSQLIASTTNLELLAVNTNIIYAKFVLKSLPDNPIVSAEDRNVPRVMFWPGKVNQHWDLAQGVWSTDEDGFSGSRENKLEYCQKFYPTTKKVVAYKNEKTNTWKDAGNVNGYVSVKQSYRCVLDDENISGDDASNVVSAPNSGSICYHFPNNPYCLPLNDPRAIRSALTLKLDNFVANGVDNNTEKLGSGERAAVLKSYEAAYRQLPETEEDFSDLVKISNGQWPSQTNTEAEKTASTEFQKIYKRIPNLNNKNDEAAITVMAYGLRQKAENRNLSSEAAALKTFKLIYGRTPSSTLDWNILQGITYSGAMREIDSDGDLLSDRREKELGTDINNKDTDNDGYFDGMEVANGHNPLEDDSK